MLVEILSNPINFFFTIAIIILAIVDLVTLHQPNHRDFKNNILGLGILGTFVGIFAGLLEFDASDIEGSIPPLLDGLKTAFWTSIFGMTTALLITILEKVTSKQGSIATTELEALLHIHRELGRTGEETKAAIVDLNGTIETSLAKISEGASAEIIRALESVIADFNTNLTNQFGENFKELNHSVKRLLEWQENYRVSVEAMEKHLNAVLQSLSSTDSTLSSIAQKNSDTLRTYESLASLLKTADSTLDDMITQTSRFSETNRQLEETLRLQRESIVATATETRQLTETIRSSLSSQSKALADLTKEINEQLPESLGSLNKTLTALTNKFGRDYESFLEKIRKIT